MTHDLDPAIDLRGRQKVRFLVEDMLALGLRPSEVAEVPQCLTIPQFRSATEALGWMYVVERTTLAHSLIHRHLLTKLPREMGRASAYLQSYGGVVGTRWREFGEIVDEAARATDAADRIVVAATEAFATQRRWIAHEHYTRAEAV